MSIIEGTGTVYCDEACGAALRHCIAEGPGDAECEEQHRRCLQTCAEMGRVGRPRSEPYPDGGAHMKGKWAFIMLLGIIWLGPSAADAQYLRSKPLIGSTAVNESGERMGNVADLILGTSGRVEYIVIQTTAGIIGTVDGVYPRARGEDGGNVGATELVAIPWRAANARTDGRQLIVGISKDKFSYAPGFREWAEFEGGSQPERARAYFGNPSSPRR